MIALPRRCFGTRYYLANLVLLLGMVRTESVQASTTSNKDRHLSPSPSLPFSCQLLEFDVLVEKESDSSGTLSDTKDCICLTEDDELLPIVLPEGLQLNHHCEAGTNVVFSNAQIFQQRLLVEPTSTISIDESGQDTRQLGIQFADKTNNDENIFHEDDHSNTMGIKSVLMVRVSTLDQQPLVSAEEFQRRVMQSSGYSMADQYKQCSFGKLQFELAQNQNVIDLVLDKEIRQYETNLHLLSAAQYQVQQMFNVDKIQSITDHIMFCLPSGLDGDWVAFAGVGDYRSAYRDSYCGTLSVSMHEVGHNLGLRHSNEDGDYLDLTGYMGVGRDVQDYPLKCFNAEKNWNLGWYNDRALKINPAVEGPHMVKLAPFVDYDKIPDEQYVLINVDDKFFVQYNRAKGMNSETEEKRNQVVIVERGKGDNSEVLDGIVRHWNQKAMAFGPYDNDSAVVFHICEELPDDVLLISIGINESICGSDDDSPFYEEMMANVGTWSSAVRKRRDRAPKGGVKQANGGSRRGIRGR